MMNVKLTQVRQSLAARTLLITSAFVVNQIIEMHSRARLYFEDGSVMLIVRPLEVEGKNVSGTFLEWKPESQE